jgi:hypothetical protein
MGMEIGYSDKENISNQDFNPQEYTLFFCRRAVASLMLYGGLWQTDKQ